MDTHDAIVTPILTVGRRFRIWAAALAGVVAWALFAWIWQLTHGLGATNLGRPVYWGLYITNFVFFIGVSHAGTLISAILRIVQAEWRRPITRMAEVITVLVLFFGVGDLLLDLSVPAADPRHRAAARSHVRVAPPPVHAARDRVGRHAEAVASARARHLGNGDPGDSGRRLRAHGCLVGVRDDDPADVAL